MGQFFRSEPMVLAQLYIQTESACLIVTELGKLGCCQFIDLNSELSAFQRKFVNVVKRCHRIEDNLRLIELELNKIDVPIKATMSGIDIITLSELMDLEITVADTVEEVSRLIRCYNDLKATYYSLLELQNALKSSRSLIDEIYYIQKSTDPNLDHGDFFYITGVIDRKRINSFERIVWRISKGNAYMQTKPIGGHVIDPVTSEKVVKNVFVIFFKGEILQGKLQKLCDGYKCTLYPFPTATDERGEILETVANRVADIKIVIRQSKIVLEEYLLVIANEVPKWAANIHRIKAVYHIINGFHCKVGGSYLIGECWLPKRDVKMVRETIQKCKKATGSYVDSFLNILETDQQPPTLYKTNKFTQCFQTIINAYGVSSYEEANPAFFSTITFPFIFAVMFGDCGHGIIIIGFSSYLILREDYFIAKNIQMEIFRYFFNGRYLILLMGFFSFYTGLIYNECFAMCLNLFGSTWNINLNLTEVLQSKEDEFQLDPRTSNFHTYILGVDPIWCLAKKNKILFFNSLKMKLSIVFGVIHMMFGVCVGITNHIHFKHYSKIFFEFIPQILLLGSVFLWLVVMIFLKWILYSAHNDGGYGTYCAPSLLVFFIDMMMMQPSKPTYPNCQVYIFEGQELLHKILLFIYVACIPFMLLGKAVSACCLNIKKSLSSGTPQRRQSRITRELPSFHDTESITSEEMSTFVRPQTLQKTEHEDEGFVYQIIHTIEFVLGTVSHTASYLRLWALSLAHSQLSEVLWDNVLNAGLESADTPTAAIPLFVISIIWMAFSFAILIIMEGLSAFLHTLRLHWVEFMSKFYKGNGYLFHPFDLQVILTEEIIENY